MLIINADDWGGWRQATDAALTCYVGGRITSATAMVFMEDSERAADLAKDIDLDIGLHLNLTQEFTGVVRTARLSEYHSRIRSFLTFNKYAVLFYNPFLREQFRYVYQAQSEEFLRLYGKPPSHIDGHQHKHLCNNMLIDRIIPAGLKVRRNFSFWPGEKGLVNRTYRRLVDAWLGRRYQLADFFFSLLQCLQTKRLSRVVELAKTTNVELMTHPSLSEEGTFLTSDAYFEFLGDVRKGTYGTL